MRLALKGHGLLSTPLQAPPPVAPPVVVLLPLPVPLPVPVVVPLAVAPLPPEAALPAPEDLPVPLELAAPASPDVPVPLPVPIPLVPELPFTQPAPINVKRAANQAYEVMIFPETNAVAVTGARDGPATFKIKMAADRALVFGDSVKARREIDKSAPAAAKRVGNDRESGKPLTAAVGRRTRSRTMRTATAIEATLQRVIVVGASSGIGEALARRLASEGAQVALVARRQVELERVAGEIRASGGKAEIFVHDATDYDAAPALFDRIAEALGGVDTLVYAAGVMFKLAEGEWNFHHDRETVEVNLLGAMAWCNPAGARFQAQRSGMIIGISSIAGERGRRAAPAYCTSKAAFTTYLEALRNRLTRYGVRVLTIKPGYVDTAMIKGLPGLFWVISADQAAARTLALARAGAQSGFVPARWSLVAFLLRLIPSVVFRRLNL